MRGEDLTVQTRNGDLVTACETARAGVLRTLRGTTSPRSRGVQEQRLRLGHDHPGQRDHTDVHRSLAAAVPPRVFKAFAMPGPGLGQLTLPFSPEII